MLVVTTSVSPQVQTRVTISRRDSIGQVDTAFFGVHPQATHCIDTSLGESEIWWQSCGLISCLAFVDVRTGTGACLGNGTWLDLRPSYSPSQADTYKLKFDGYPPMVFHWDRDVGSYYGAMTLMNALDTTLATIKVNMVAQDSFVVTRQPWTMQWYIFASAPHSVTGVRFEESKFPGSPGLAQNYPNPFNPETRISYSVPTAGYVSLAIHDVLGRAVAILVNENQQPGDYSVVWNPSGVPSGVYFYRLQTGEVIVTKRMALMR